MNPDKSRLRRGIRERLGELPAELRITASAVLRQQLSDWPLFQQARVITLFHSTPAEPDVLPLLQIPGKTFLFPLCHPEDRSLSWHAPLHLSRWKPGPFGILQPDPQLSPAVSSSGIDLVLVPGLGFTEAGDRLGHGAGYYDRFLASLPSGIPTAGVCFRCQLVPELPSESHDVRVQHLFYA